MLNSRLISVILLFFAVFFYRNTLYCQPQTEKVIEAEGIAAVKGEGNGNLLIARDEAVKRALRQAVEEGVGTLIDSESLSQNFQLLNDEIYSQVKGYVREYKIISDNNGEENIYRITVKATVVLGSLEKDLKALNIIKHEKGNPRVMVLFAEVMDGLPIAGNIVQTKMEKIFLKHGFPVVDKSQFQAIQSRDAALNYADPMKAVSLGRRFGAEVVIVGQASSDLVDSSRPYGVSVFYYQAQVSAKAIKVDTAQIMAVETVETDWRKPGQGQGSGRTEAAKQALNAAGESISDNMIKQILKAWRSEVFNTVTIEVVAENVNGKRRKNFKKELENIQGVESVNERNYTNQVLVLDLEVQGSIWNNFDERLESFETIGVELTGKTQNRIDVKLFDLE